MMQPTDVDMSTLTIAQCAELKREYLKDAFEGQVAKEIGAKRLEELRAAQSRPTDVVVEVEVGPSDATPEVSERRHLQEGMQRELSSYDYMSRQNTGHSDLGEVAPPVASTE